MYRFVCINARSRWKLEARGHQTSDGDIKAVKVCRSICGVSAKDTRISETISGICDTDSGVNIWVTQKITQVFFWLYHGGKPGHVRTLLCVWESWWDDNAVGLCRHYLYWAHRDHVCSRLMIYLRMLCPGYSLHQE